MPTTMKTRRFLALCRATSVVAFGVGSAAAWLPSRTVTATGCDGAVSRVVLDGEPAEARRGILRTLLHRLTIRSV